MHKNSELKKPIFKLKPACAAVLLAFGVSNVQANPLGGSVISGQASFANNGNILTVTNTPGAIINWQEFSIQQNEITRFAQQSASSAVLNRVITNNPSLILGSLQSNGRVFLVNPSGIVFGAGSTVDVAGLVATSLNLSDADFQSGRMNFSQVPGAQAVSNAGNITTQSGGEIYLIAPNVNNSGVITAPNGDILLAAGNSVELVNSLDPNLRVNITAAAGDATNVGQLVASAGNLGLFGTVVKNTGTVSADSATQQGGKIVFRSSQRTEVSGTASAQGAGGGEIKVLSDMHSGTVNVSGTLDASSPIGGNGGFIDTSAAHVQVANSARVNTLATNGKNGIWLIDPVDFTIAATGGDMTGAALSASLLTTSVSILSTAGTVNAVTGLGDVNVNDVVNWSANTLTLNAQNNININANLNGSGTGSLALQYGQQAVAAGNTSGYKIATGVRIDLPAGQNFSTKLGSDGVLQNFTVITSLGSPGSVSGSDLQGISASLAGNFVLGANIDATATSTWNTALGFDPIGNATTPFTGKFDGLGHSIGSLTVSRNTQVQVGLFGYVGNTGSVSNIGLLNPVVSANSSVGALVGYNLGAISNSFVSGGTITAINSSAGAVVGENLGTVSGSFASGGTVHSGGWDAGGLVGRNTSGTISGSYASGVAVISDTTDAGGLVGYNAAGAIIANSFVTGGSVYAAISSVGGLVGENAGTVATSYVSGGTISGGANVSNAGGLVGRNTSGSISNSYVTGGTISAQLSAGGLVGFNAGGASISTSYAATGNVSAPGGNAGGLVGAGTGAVSNSYWDVTTSGLATSAGGAGAVGLTTSQFFSTASFTGFAFGTTPGTTGWVIVDLYSSLNNTGGVPGATRPMLLSEYTTNIINAHQLQLMALNPAAHYTLSANIDATTTNGTASPAGMWSGAGFTPIGSTSTPTRFSGIFDGQSHSINGLYINRPSTSNVGLFGYTQGSTIKNVSLTNTNVTGGSYVGGLVGLHQGTIAFSSNVSGSVTGSNSVGGLVGLNSDFSVIDNCSAGSVVNGPSSVGGLVGASQRATISNSTATGNVIGVSYVGGLVGYSGYSSDVTNSSASGSVSGNIDVGGLVGFNAFNIVGSSASGAVSGTTDVGGLVGNNSTSTTYGSISNSSATGNVTGISNVGGLVGANNTGASILNSSNASGSVTGSASVGGLVGFNYGIISNANSIGNVIGSGSAITALGGLVGSHSGGSISLSFATGSSVTGIGGASIGGLVGNNTSNISNCYASGVAVSGGAVIGGLVGSSTGTISDSYVSIGSVSGTSNIGGLIGDNNGALSNSHYNINLVTINGGYVVTLGGLYNDNTASSNVMGQFDDWLNHGKALSISNYTLPYGSFETPATNIYTISTVQGLKDMLGFADNALYTFKLSANIDLTGTTGFYIPLLASDFDGAGFKVSKLGLSIANSNLGLFGHVLGSSAVSNIVLEDASVVGGSNLGVLAGWNEGTISAVSIGKSVNGGVTLTGLNSVGGLVGLNTGFIGNSFVTSATVAGASNIGGLLGNNSTLGSISGSYVGSGTVAASAHHVGGLVGLESGGIRTNSFFNIDAVTTNGANNVTLGGLYATQYSNWFNGGVLTPLSITNFTGSLVLQGDGSYGISTMQGMKDMLGFADDPAAYNFSLLVPNIDLTAGFYVPKLAGDFNGNNHTLSNLNINLPNDDMGLFGVISVGSLVNNLGLVNANVAGHTSVGALVGNNYFGGVAGSHVSTSSVTGHDNVGGLVGFNEASRSALSVQGLISNSYVTNGSVTGIGNSLSNNVGGLAGLSSGFITGSYVLNANVNGGLASMVGGLVGGNVGRVTRLNSTPIFNGGEISNSYVIGGTVTSSGNDVGGLVGNSYGGQVDLSYVESLTVSGGLHVGGLVGNDSGEGWSSWIGVVSNSHADNTQVTGDSNVGGLIGYIGYTSGNGGATYAAVLNSYVNHGTVSGSVSSITSATEFGGLVGNNVNQIIDNSYVIGTNVSGDWNVGGLAGKNSGNIINTYVNGGNVSGTSSVGGLVGFNVSGGTVSFSYASNGAVTGGLGSTGGVVGYNAGSVHDNFWDFALINAGGNLLTGIGNDQSASGFATDKGTIGYNTADFMLQNNFTYYYDATTDSFSGWNFGLSLGTWWMVDGFTRPFLRSEWNNTITNAHQLQLMAMTPTASYTLANNLDLAAELNNTSSTGMWSNSGFVPIGKASQFIGTFNGLNHVISNLKINRPTDGYVGLFGDVGAGGLVSNVGLVNANVNGSFNVGVLAGHNLGSISNSFVQSSNVRGTSSSGVGGLVGFNGGNINNSFVSGGTVDGGNWTAGGLVGQNGGSINSSYVTGGTVVSGGGSTSLGGVGGLVGNNNGGTVSGSYVSGGSVTSINVGGAAGGLVGHSFGGTISGSYVSNVSVTGDTDVGGLVGFNRSIVRNSYVTGSTIFGATNVGGLVGNNASQSTTGGVSRVGDISNTYVSNGAVFGTTNSGGLVGFNDSFNGALVGSSYWNLVTTGGGPTFGIGNDSASANAPTDIGAVHLTTAQMHQQSSFSGWDFVNTWRSYTGHSAPFLKSFLTPVSVTASGITGNFNKTYDAVAWNAPALGTLTYSVQSAAGLLHELTPFGAPVTDAGTYEMLWSDQQGYDISYTAGGLLTISAASVNVLGITANNATKSYGSTFNFLGTAFTSVGLLGGDSISSVTLTSAGAAAEDIVGDYAITPSAAVFSVGNASNYNITYVDGVLTVNPVTLTYTANATNRLYGGNDPTFSGTVTGFVLGQDSTSTSGSLIFTSTTGISSNVGSYAITGSGLTANNGNYVFVQAASNATAHTISPATLTYTANIASRSYGETNPAFSGTVTGFVLGESVTSATTGATTFGTSAVNTSNVGSYAINGSGLSANNGNYVFAQAASNSTAFSITQRIISLTADVASKVYGDADPGSYSVGGAGLASFDTKASVFTGSLSHAGGENQNVVGGQTAPYVITQGTLVANSNYSISSFTGNNLTITQAPLTVKANSPNKILGTNDPLLTYMVSGLRFSDSEAATLSGALSRETGDIIGSYAITQGSLDLLSSNYSMNFVPGTLRILAPTVVQEITQTSQMFGSPKADQGDLRDEEEEREEVAKLAAVSEISNEEGGGRAEVLPVCR